jgi:3-oxoadipate enol-lactonase
MLTNHIYSTVTGTGPAVILIHALGFDHTMWRDLTNVLATSRTVIQIDLRGHGKSLSSTHPFSLDDLADDVAQVLEAYNIECADLIGLSLGGMVGQAFALKHPLRLNKLVLACTTSSYGEIGNANWTARIDAVEKGGMESIVEVAMERFFSPFFRQTRGDLVNESKAQFLKADPKGYVLACKAIANLNFADHLNQIKSKTLVIAGELDISAPVHMAEYLADKITGSQLSILPNVAHLPNIESPVTFNHQVIAFLHEH